MAAQTWVAHGDTSGRLHIRVAFVESITMLDGDILERASVRIRMISGIEYYGYFVSQEERDRFVGMWAGDTIAINVEPAVEVE